MPSTTLKTYELPACPGCGGTEMTEFFHGEHVLRRCTSCLLVSAPRYGDPDEIYVDGYLFGETDFGLDLTDPEFQRYLEHCARVRMAIIEKAAGRAGRFLDVGCGTGEVLDAARSRGWEVQGVDPVVASASYATEHRGLDVRATLLEDSGLPERSYDVVGAFHVVEHMTDGKEFLRLLARWVRPGGYVAIETPNWRSVHRRLLGQSWPHLRPLEHIAYYSPATLAATMRHAGLEPVRVATPSFLWGGQTLRQQLIDLGLVRWDGWVRPLGRPRESRGDPATVPNRLGVAVLSGVQRLYDRAKVGAVVLGIARVP